MALSDLAVFSEWVYLSQTEVLRQQVDKFNAASQGTILLRSAANVGNYSEEAFWKKLTGLVRRRNPFGTGAVAPITLQHLIDTMVKVAAGTPPVLMPPSQFRWIQRNPEEGGTIVGQQLAGDTLADMLNVAIGSAAVALSNDAGVTTDVSAVAAPGNLVTIGNFNTAQSKFGDAYQDIRSWVMHSKPLFDVFGAAITNNTSLFSFETINVRQDGFGRTFIITDSPQLIITGSPNKYRTIGLTPAGILVEQNADFDDNVDVDNGDENILRSYQAEWSYNLGIKGYAWDKASGGAAPTTAALLTATNWDRYATSHKDLAGVLLISQ